MATDDIANDRNPGNDDDAKQSQGEESGAVTQVRALITAEMMGLASDLADARLAVVKGPPSLELQLYGRKENRLTEIFNDWSIEDTYWAVLIVFVGILALRTLFASSK